MMWSKLKDIRGCYFRICLLLALCILVLCTTTEITSDGPFVLVCSALLLSCMVAVVYAENRGISRYYTQLEQINIATGFFIGCLLGQHGSLHVSVVVLVILAAMTFATGSYEVYCAKWTNMQRITPAEDIRNSQDASI